MVTRDRSHWQMGLAGLLIGASLMSWSSLSGERANAEVRRATPTEADQHFKSGGRLAESVLQEILVVLKRMDERLARLEKVAQGATRGSPLQATRVNDQAPAAAEGESLPEIKVRRAP